MLNYNTNYYYYYCCNPYKKQVKHINTEQKKKMLLEFGLPHEYFFSTKKEKKNSVSMTLL